MFKPCKMNIHLYYENDTYTYTMLVIRSCILFKTPFDFSCFLIKFQRPVKILESYAQESAVLQMTI